MRLSGAMIFASAISCASKSAMDADLQRIARRALEKTQAAGKDYLGQTGATVRAVRIARPDITASEALAAVNFVRQS